MMKTINSSFKQCLVRFSQLFTYTSKRTLLRRINSLEQDNKLLKQTISEIEAKVNHHKDFFNSTLVHESTGKTLFITYYDGCQEPITKVFKFNTKNKEFSFENIIKLINFYCHHENVNHHSPAYQQEIIDELLLKHVNAKL